MNMVSSPKILFLDEPTVGMDVQSRKALWEMMLKIQKELGTTIFLTTHYLEEADELSDSICIMKNGKELAQGNPSSLRSYIRQNMIRITFPTNKEAKNIRIFSLVLVSLNLVIYVINQFLQVLMIVKQLLKI